MADRSITEIGKYKILDVVGEGAMGVVYQATDSVLNRTVAIKVMSESIARQQDLRDRFLREAQAAGSMQHPNIVSIYDLGEMGGHLFIAMEFVEGMDLEHIIVNNTPLSLQAKLDIIIDVLAGLAYAHKRGIVHRDIKPANIRITEDGRAKIMDFGVAHLSSSTMTRTGMIVGTPAYMAPEQVTGAHTTAATDLFAVGAVLYELLTGLKAFAAPTLQSLFFKIVSEPPVSMMALQPGLPEELNRMTDKALEKNPANRYATALDMANDLSSVRAKLIGAPHPGGRASFGYDSFGGTGADCNGHGTHVAGTVGGTTYGVAKNVTLKAVRVLDCNGSGSWSGVIAGMDWVAANHVAGTPAVANMSLGSGASSSVDAAVNRMISDGVATAVAAGNGNWIGIAQDACRYSPARVAAAMTIGATSSSDARASWSNYGACVDWFAPGVSITSAWTGSNTATSTISGTSMATPHTAGVAALYLSVAGNASASPSTVRTALYNLTTKDKVTNSKSSNDHLLYSNF